MHGLLAKMITISVGSDIMVFFTLRSSVCAYTLLRRVLIHADWPSPTPSTTLPLYEMITCFI